MEKHQQKREQDMPAEATELVHVSQLGPPLSAYWQPLIWFRFWVVGTRILLGVVVCLLVLRLFLEVSGWLQMQMLQSQHPADHLQALFLEDQILQRQNELIIGLYGVFEGIVVSGFFLFLVRYMARTISRYWLVCRDGCICVFSNHQECIRWSEVSTIVKQSKRRYTLVLSEKKLISFGYPLIAYEEMTDLVRTFVQKPTQDP